ncbi:hypothetical protein BX600DRAFT_468809 [Xylariales sp. PMI_506]|nr:hypothetical protein BX600DRAFT_468809 [Xylariales sp. PMI_506]
MSKILAVFGATGIQGSSVINHVLNDPELSQQYKIRAIVRDLSSDKAKNLQGKVELVQGDMSDPSSLGPALAGAHTVFAMTTPSFSPDALEVEYAAGKAIADAAVAQGVEYLIFSTLPATTELSEGKYTHVTPFDAKAKVEKYIRGLPIRSAFVSLAFYMENFQNQPYLSPKLAADGTTWELCRPVSAKTRAPFINAVADVGKFVGAILAEPEVYEGKVFCAAEGHYTFEEIAAILSKSTGKTVVSKQVPLEEFRDTMPFLSDVFADGFLMLEDYGYFGKGSEELVAWAASKARGKLTSLEEYFAAHPLELA